MTKVKKRKKEEHKDPVFWDNLNRFLSYGEKFAHSIEKEQIVTKPRSKVSLENRKKQ